MSLQYKSVKFKYLHSLQQVEGSRSIAQVVSIQEQLRRLLLLLSALLLLLLLLLLPTNPLSLAIHVLAQLIQIQVYQV